MSRHAALNVPSFVSHWPNVFMNETQACHKTQRPLHIYSTAFGVSANAANEIGITQHDSSCLSA